MPSLPPIKGAFDMSTDDRRPDPASDDSRFPPRGAASQPSPLVPGVVEVELRPGLGAQALSTLGETAPGLTAQDGALGALNAVLQKHQVREVVPALAAQPPSGLTAAVMRPALPDVSGLFSLRFPGDADIAAIAGELAQLPEVMRAVPVPRARPPLDPLGEPLVGSSDQTVSPERQWYVFRCQADDAWRRASGAGVVVADVDWGYRLTHQDLTGIEAAGAFNSYDGGSNVSWGGNVDHGTGVTGLAAATANALGMAGFAPGAAIWPIQANDGPGAPLPGDSWARGIEHVRTAADARRKVVILEVQTGSFGNYEMVPSANAAIRAAIAEGVVVCVAAGNGDRDAGLDDSALPFPETGSILVGATEYDPAANPRAWFSNFGPRVVVSAPGDPGHDLTCSHTGDGAYRDGFGGTSGATPKVAGTAALMLSVNPALSHREIRTLLHDTGSQVVTAPGKPVGTFLDSAAALEEAWLDVNGRLLSVTGNQDGRLEVFAWGLDSALWHIWQTAPNNGWGGWASRGGTVDRLAAIRNSDGRLEVFVRGADGGLWHDWQTAPNNGWHGWSALGGEIDNFVVARNQDGRLEVFARGMDKGLWHIWQTAPNNGWSGWASLGGQIDRLAADRNQDGRLEVFARGMDKALWHLWQTAPGGGWSSWESLGGEIDLLATARNQDGRLEVFARGMDKALWHLWQTAPNSGWSAWESLGGEIDLLAAARNQDGRLEVFARGMDKALWHIWQTAPNSGWHGWASLGGEIDRLAVGNDQDGRLEVFARGMDKALWHIWQTAPNSGWSGWASLGGQIS
jgi:subtilisin family serine protease